MTTLPKGLLLNTQTISATGTYTPTAGVKRIRYKLVGSSAGGGSTSGAGGNSGASSLGAIAVAGAATGGGSAESSPYRGADATSSAGDAAYRGQAGGLGGKRSDGGGTYNLTGGGGFGITVEGAHELTAGEISSGIAVTIGAAGTTSGSNGATVGLIGILIIDEYS